MTGKIPASTGIGQPPSASRKRSSAARSKTICVIAKRAPAAIFSRKRSSSSSKSSAVGLTATPTKNDVGASIGRPSSSSPWLSAVTSRVRPIASTSNTACERSPTSGGSPVMASTLRTPSACVPSSIDSSPRTVQSRVVRCGTVSRPVSRSSRAETISELMPARAVALSTFQTVPPSERHCQNIKSRARLANST